VPGHWKHGWIPLDEAAAKSKGSSFSDQVQGDLMAKVTAKQPSRSPRVGDVVDSLNGKPLTKVDAVVDGVVFVKHRDDTWSLDDATRQTTAKNVNAVLKQFPGVKPPQITQGAGAESMANAGPRGIALSRAMTDDAEAARQARDWDGVSIGLPGADGRRKAVLVHEMGHYLNHALDADPAAKAEYLAIVNEPVTPRQLGFSVGSPEQLDKVMPRWQTDSLSTSGSPRDSQSVYANENSREWFGEAFADAFLHGDQASDSSKRLFSVLRKHLGGPRA
jgi:hypothetical protein